MDLMNPEIEKLIKNKEQRRKRLAGLPWPEKVRILIQMQRMIVPVVQHRNPRACVWKIFDYEERSDSNQGTHLQSCNEDFSPSSKM